MLSDALPLDTRLSSSTLAEATDVWYSSEHQILQFSTQIHAMNRLAHETKFLPGGFARQPIYLVYLVNLLLWLFYILKTATSLSYSAGDAPTITNR